MEPLSRGAMMLAACLCCGCASFGHYMRNRGLDFVDCFKLEAGVGLGVDVDVHATDWLATGAGAAASRKWGFAGRHVVGVDVGEARTGFDVHVAPPVAPFLVWITPRRSLDGLGIDSSLRYLYTDLCARDCYPPCPPFEPRHVKLCRTIVVYSMTSVHDADGKRAEKLVDAFDLNVGATVLPISLRAGLSLGQFLDFVLGWSTLDIASDDWALAGLRRGTGDP